MVDLNTMSIQKLKQMNQEDLTQLAQEIRAFLIDNVLVTGGHLASNLGVVELSIALHRVLDSPEDKIVWDVGHQSYVHKILTGRAGVFTTLRQHDGLCGFPRRTESEHDAFDTGHSSTSLSAAMGMACGFQQQGKTNRVVAVIGDGALTGGMVYEAINNIASSRVPMTIILNDNGMSISPGVGAVHYQLAKIRTAKGYINIKSKIAKRTPRMKVYLERMKNIFKYSLIDSAMFEEWGLKYIGPIDGHDEEALETVLRQSQNWDVPILIHVCTKKGKGYAEAESNPAKFHGVSPRMMSKEGDSPKIQRTIQAIPSNSDVVGNTLLEKAQQDPALVVITAAMTDGTGLSAFAKKYPERLYDVGIAEGHAVTFAGGLACAGMKPVFAVYSTFLQRAYDQVLHDICLQRLPVRLAIDRAGLVGADGATHHGVYDIAYLSQMPNMVCCAPGSQEELKAMIEFACDYDEGPISIRYPRTNLPSTEQSIQPIEMGTWVADGKMERIAMVAVGEMLPVASKIKESLHTKGVEVTIVNPRFIKPMDETMLQQMAKCDYVVVMEDGIKQGGLGEQISAILSNEPVVVHAFALPEEPMLHGTVAELLTEAGLTAKNMEQIMWQELQGRIYARKNQA